MKIDTVKLGIALGLQQIYIALVEAAPQIKKAIDSYREKLSSETEDFKFSINIHLAFNVNVKDPEKPQIGTDASWSVSNKVVATTIQADDPKQLKLDFANVTN